MSYYINRYNTGRRNEEPLESRPTGGRKPVEEGKEYNVKITDVSRRGDGVAKVQGFIVFVKGAKSGEDVKIRIDSVGPRSAIASVVESKTTTTAAAPNSS